MIYNFEQALQNDVTVKKCLDLKISFEDALALLAHEKSELVKIIMHLETIAPRAYRLPDGSIKVWRCPDHLIPVTELT